MVLNQMSEPCFRRRTVSVLGVGGYASRPVFLERESHNWADLLVNQVMLGKTLFPFFGTAGTGGDVEGDYLHQYHIIYFLYQPQPLGMLSQSRR